MCDYIFDIHPKAERLRRFQQALINYQGGNCDECCVELNATMDGVHMGYGEFHCSEACHSKANASSMARPQMQERTMEWAGDR